MENKWISSKNDLTENYIAIILGKINLILDLEL